MRTLQSHRPSSRQVSPPSPRLFPRAETNSACNRFSEDFPNIHFVKIDVDEVPDVAQELGIRAMPTFVIFKNEEKVAEVVGANPKALLAAVEKANAE